MMSPALPCIPNRTGPSSTELQGLNCVSLSDSAFIKLHVSESQGRKEMTPASGKWEKPPDRINYHTFFNSESVPLLCSQG